MASVEVSRAAREDLEELIRTHSLPADTTERLKRSLRPLRRFPNLGAQLLGRWSRYRFVLGPWRWMIVVYPYLEDDDRVVIVTIQDGRSSVAATRAQLVRPR